MRRIATVLGLVLILVLSTSMAALADENPTVAPLGQPADAAQAKMVKSTVKVFAGRVGRHDAKALSMLSDTARQQLFTADPDMAKTILDLRFKISEIKYISDVRVLDDGSLFVTVNFVGFYAAKNFQTIELHFVVDPNSTKYYQISQALPIPAQLPEDSEVGELDLTFTDGIGTVTPEPDVPVTPYTRIKITADAAPHAVVIYAADADRTKIENQLGTTAVGPNQTGELVVAGLEPGKYVFVDMAAQGADVDTFTVK